MVKYFIPAGGEKLKLNATITVQNPVDLMLVGVDTKRPRTIYFKREIQDFVGKHTIEVPMPVTPENLTLYIYDHNRHSNKSIAVNNFFVSPLPFSLPSEFSTEKDKEYYVFMLWFCENFKYLPLGHYYSEYKNYSIDYVRKIFEQNGTESTTPSRINRVTAEIEVSADKCKDMTVYMMCMILCHEYFHFRIKSTDEEAVDAKAMQLYKSMGFPSSEALYSFINVFDPKTDTHAQALKQRVDKLYSFLAGQPR